MTAIRPPGASISSAAGQGGLESAQLVVDGDPERLEDPPPMPVAEPGGRRDRGLDRLHELARRLERMLAPLTNDALRDLPRIALLAVRAEDLRQLPLLALVHELAGRNVRGRVHAHVQRRVGRVREPALGPVELHARDAEVEEDRVGAAAVVGEPLQHVGEVLGQEPQS